MLIILITLIIILAAGVGYNQRHPGFTQSAEDPSDEIEAGNAFSQGRPAEVVAPGLGSGFRDHDFRVRTVGP